MSSSRNPTGRVCANELPVYRYNDVILCVKNSGVARYFNDINKTPCISIRRHCIIARTVAKKKKKSIGPSGFLVARDLSDPHFCLVFFFTFSGLIYNTVQYTL